MYINTMVACVYILLNISIHVHMYIDYIHHTYMHIILKDKRDEEIKLAVYVKSQREVTS